MKKIRKAWGIFRSDGGVAVVTKALARAAEPFQSRLNARKTRLTYGAIPIARPGNLAVLGFYPTAPDDRRYTISKMVRALGIGMQNGRHGITMAWSDQTFSEKVENAINGDCTDISKAHVAEVFGKTFGYSLAIDPLTHAGLCVEKSNINARHDGRVVMCPRPPISDCVYQLVVNNRIGKFVEDLRIVVIGQEIPVAYLNYRLASNRFANINKRAYLAQPRDILSHNEIDQILRYCREIKLDYGELDVLRDRTNRLIYIVDVAKTPFGPPNLVKLVDKLWAINAMAESFERAFLRN